MGAHPFLPVYAAPVEGEALARLGAIELGVGKAAAAAALAELLGRQRPQAVLLFGLCGVYPDRHRKSPSGLQVGSLCLVGDDRLADEGVLTPGGFRSLAQLDLGDVGPFAMDPERTARAAALLRAPVVPGATVSTCSGTEVASATLAARTGAAVETMEGAAVALVCRRFSVPLVQLRCACNFTGDRDRGGWDLAVAAVELQRAVEQLLDAG